MTDPTPLVVMSTFGLGIGAFLAGWFWRGIRQGSHPSRPHPDSILPPSSVEPPPVPLEIRGCGVSPGPYSKVDLVIIGLFFLLFGLLTWSNLQTGEMKPSQVNPAGLVISMLMQVMMAGMVVLWVGLRFSLVEWLGLRWPRWPSVFWITPLALFGVWMVMLAIMQSGLLQWLQQHGVETSQDSVKLLKEANDPQVIGLMAFAAVVVAPICEEVLFRGYFYPAVKHHGGAVCAALVSALVFSSAHASLVALLPLFLLGLLFVWLYEKTGSIWAPIALHFAFNSATVLLQLVARWLDLPLQSP